MAYPLMINTKQYHILNDGMIQIKFHIGFVAGIMYQGTEWLIGENGLTGYDDACKVCEKKEQAQKLLDSHKYKEQPFVRKYYYWKDSYQLSDKDYARYQELRFTNRAKEQNIFENYVENDLLKLHED